MNLNLKADAPVCAFSFAVFGMLVVSKNAEPQQK